MTPRPSILNTILKNESYAETLLSDTGLKPEEISELRQKVLTDFRLLKMLLIRLRPDTRKKTNIELLAGELAMATKTAVQCKDVLNLEFHEQRIREEIRSLLGNT